MLPANAVAFMAQFGMKPTDIQTVETMLRDAIVGMMREALQAEGATQSATGATQSATAEEDHANKWQAHRRKVANLRELLEKRGIQTKAKMSLGILTKMCAEAGIDVGATGATQSATEGATPSASAVAPVAPPQDQSAKNSQLEGCASVAPDPRSSRARESSLDSNNITNHSSTSHRYREPNSETQDEPKANPRFIAFRHRSGMNRFPSDLGRMIEEWDKAGLDFDQDVLPVVARVADELSRSGKPAPYKARFFDDAIHRAKAEHDAHMAAATAVGERQRHAQISAAEFAARNAIEDAATLAAWEEEDSSNWPETRFARQAKLANEAMGYLKKAVALGIDLRALAVRERVNISGVEWFERQLAAQLETAK